MIHFDLSLCFLPVCTLNRHYLCPLYAIVYLKSTLIWVWTVCLIRENFAIVLEVVGVFDLNTTLRMVFIKSKLL